MENPNPEVYDQSIEPSEALTKLRSLTPRERDVISEVCKGKSLREVATTLGLAISTAGNHKTSAYRKLKVRNAIQLMLWAFEAGLLKTAKATQREDYFLALRSFRS